MSLKRRSTLLEFCRDCLDLTFPCDGDFIRAMGPFFFPLSDRALAAELAPTGLCAFAPLSHRPARIGLSLRL